MICFVTHSGGVSMLQCTDIISSFSTVQIPTACVKKQIAILIIIKGGKVWMKLYSRLTIRNPDLVERGHDSVRCLMVVLLGVVMWPEYLSPASLPSSLCVMYTQSSLTHKYSTRAWCLLGNCSLLVPPIRAEDVQPRKSWLRQLGRIGTLQFTGNILYP